MDQLIQTQQRVVAGEAIARRVRESALTVTAVSAYPQPVSPASLPARQQRPTVHLRDQAPTPQHRLSTYLRIGSSYHPLCRFQFVEHKTEGFYAYERRTTTRTCALAAIYAGVFGPDSVKAPHFSYSMAVWRLSNLLNVNLQQLMVTGPTGRYNNVADEMIQLVDQNYWTREGVADWLERIGL